MYYWLSASRAGVAKGSDEATRLGPSEAMGRAGLRSPVNEGALQNPRLESTRSTHLLAVDGYRWMKHYTQTHLHW